MEQLIINTEFFLQCYGHCAGCFLTEAERDSKSIYIDTIKDGIKEISKNYTNEKIGHLVIGFGRGNILNLSKGDLDKLLDLMEYSKSFFIYDELTFEVSTSLIGKMDKQIENALYVLDKNKDVFFNIVINSEITSLQFWKNLQMFLDATGSYRKNNWNSELEDIIVLNVNPEKLPDISFIKEFTENHYSALNISIFPFVNNAEITQTKLNQVIEWSSEIWNNLKHKDLNIKNYLYNLNKVNIDNDFNDILAYQEKTEGSYHFIDKVGKITGGSLSIMGEVDKLRLLDKYNLQLDLKNAHRLMQKVKACALCDYQKECLLSGAYLNLVANQKNTTENSICMSGYQKVFQLAQN